MRRTCLILFKLERYLLVIVVLSSFILTGCLQFYKYDLSHRFTIPLIPQASNLDTKILWFNTSYAFDKSETVFLKNLVVFPKSRVLLFHCYQRVKIISWLFTFM